MPNTFINLSKLRAMFRIYRFIYNLTYQGLQEIGVKQHYLTEEAMGRLFTVVERYLDNISKDVIFKVIKW